MSGVPKNSSVPKARVKKAVARGGSVAAPVEKEPTLAEMAELAVRFPFLWFSQGRAARICGFSEEVMSALAAAGAPIVARKCNPHLLHKWLEANFEKLGKIRTGL